VDETRQPLAGVCSRSRKGRLPCRDGQAITAKGWLSPQIINNQLPIINSNYRLSIRTIRIFASPVFVLYVLQVLFPMRGASLSSSYVVRRTTQDETKLRPITKAGGFLFYRDAKAYYFSTLQGNGKTTRAGRKAILATAIVIHYRTYDYGSVSTTSHYSLIAISI